MSDKTNTNLKEAGLKATLPRIKILEILQATSGTHHHYTAEDIYRELVINNYDIGLATVYRVLTQFENAGIVVKHQFDATLVSGIVLVLKEKPYFMSDEFTLVDCYMSAILYRLPYLGVITPNSKSFESLRKYQEKLFSRPSFDLSLTDAERDLKYSFN